MSKISPGFAKEQSLVAVLELRNLSRFNRTDVSALTTTIRQAASYLPKSQFGLITKENISVMLPPGRTLEDCQGECEALDPNGHLQPWQAANRYVQA